MGLQRLEPLFFRLFMVVPGKRAGTISVIRLARARLCLCIVAVQFAVGRMPSWCTFTGGSSKLQTQRCQQL